MWHLHGFVYRMLSKWYVMNELPAQCVGNVCLQQGVGITFTCPRQSHTYTSQYHIHTLAYIQIYITSN